MGNPGRHGRHDGAKYDYPKRPSQIILGVCEFSYNLKGIMHAFRATTFNVQVSITSACNNLCRIPIPRRYAYIYLCVSVVILAQSYNFGQDIALCGSCS